MIFFVIIPLLTGAFGNFLIPLMIGARDMAFPRLNMLSYWFMWPAFVIITYSFFVEGGRAGSRLDELSDLDDRPLGDAGLAQRPDLLAAGASCSRASRRLMGSINYITTIVMLRAPGMKMFRMPMTVWAMFITALLQAFALPVLTSALIMQTLDRVVGTNFFSPVGWTVANAPPVVGGGGPMLFQHLFWFYSHPAVYVMILPAMGMVSDIIATFSRKPLFGYKPMVLAIAGIAGLGFIVWGHHMFQSGMNPALGATFMLSTMMIALPSAIKVFNWLGTMWGGRHPVHLGDAQRHGVRGHVRHRRPVGHLHGGHPGRHAHSRHLLHRRPHSLRALRRQHVRHLRGDLLLVPQDVRPDDEREAGAHPLRPHVHLLQRHVLPDAHHRHARPSPADRRPDHLSLPARRGRDRHEPVHDLSTRSCWG